jgi:hypothetical protein
LIVIVPLLAQPPVAVAELWTLGDYALMKTHKLYFALALGLLIYGGHTGTAQQLVSSAPIIIQLSEIDRYGISVWPPAKVTDGGQMGIPYRDMKESEVEILIKNGTFWNRSVWVMDGQRIIAKCSLIGEFRYQLDPKSETKYGLFVGFDSVEESQKVGASLKLVPSLDKLILSQKRNLDDIRYWR